MTLPATPDAPDDLRALLERAREALLAAVTGLTERDFAAEVEGGPTVTRLLADLARAEHETLREARAAAGLAPRPHVEGGEATPRPLPPQLMHALAGTQYEARVLLDELEAAGTPLPEGVARLLAEGVAVREVEAARRIEGRTRDRASG